MSTPAPPPERRDDPAAAPPPPPTSRQHRRDVLDRERAAFGGVKVGSAFFGWLTATGMTVLLAALVAATGAGVGEVTTAEEVRDTAAQAGIGSDDLGWVGVVLLLVVVLLAYYAGGYVAGRMARLDGARQGFAVWVWAVVVAIVVAVLAAIGGREYDVLGDVNAFPRLPESFADLTVEGQTALIGVVVASLVGAVLGGLAGMRYHRKVDRAGLGL